MTKYIIIPADKEQELVAKYGEGIKASDYACVGPVKIMSGAYAGAYAVSSDIFETDKCFEQFRDVFSAFDTAEIDLNSLNQITEEVAATDEETK